MVIPIDKDMYTNLRERINDVKAVTERISSRAGKKKGGVHVLPDEREKETERIYSIRTHPPEIMQSKY